MDIESLEPAKFLATIPVILGVDAGMIEAVEHVPSVLAYLSSSNAVLQISSDVRQAKMSRKASALRRAWPRSTSRSRNSLRLTHVRKNLPYFLEGDMLPTKAAHL